VPHTKQAHWHAKSDTPELKLIALQSTSACSLPVPHVLLHFPHQLVILPAALRQHRLTAGTSSGLEVTRSTGQALQLPAGCGRNRECTVQNQLSAAKQAAISAWAVLKSRAALVRPCRCLQVACVAEVHSEAMRMWKCWLCMVALGNAYLAYAVRHAGMASVAMSPFAKTVTCAVQECRVCCR
jgi:hypothetical protein